jgi:hypothetical protein
MLLHGFRQSRRLRFDDVGGARNFYADAGHVTASRRHAIVTVTFPALSAESTTKSACCQRSAFPCSYIRRGCFGPIAKDVGNQLATARANMSDVNRCLESLWMRQEGICDAVPITGESSGNLTTNLGVRSSNLFGRAITIKTHMFWD